MKRTPGGYGLGRRRRSTLLHLIAIVTLVVAGARGSPSAEAQTTLTDALSHEIVATFEVALGTAEGGGMVESEWLIPWRAPWGDYFLTGAGPAVQTFDPTGRFLHRFERPGEGPDELLQAGRVLFRGDSVFVFDPRQPRSLVLDRSLRVQRMVSLPIRVGRFGAIGWGDSLMLVAAHIDDDAHRGNPYQLLDFDGRHHGSMGEAGPPYRDDQTASSQRLLARADSSTVWTARPTVYAFQQVTLDGGVVRSFRHTPDFFPAENDGARHPNETPPAVLSDLREDAKGRLWLLFLVPDPRWREAVDTTGGFHGARIANYDLYYDSVVEVVDPASASVIARRRFSPVILGLLADRSIAYNAFQAGAVPVVRIETLTLERRVP